MSDIQIRVRANRIASELEIEGPPHLVSEWWEKLWPEMGKSTQASEAPLLSGQRQSLVATAGNEQLPEVFGEFFSEFRSDVTDVEKMLVAGAFVQSKEPDRAFSTKAANQLLLDQNIKVGNPSESVRRLTQAKRVFVVSDGKFRVSAAGQEHLRTLKVGLSN